MGLVVRRARGYILLELDGGGGSRRQTHPSRNAAASYCIPISPGGRSVLVHAPWDGMYFEPHGGEKGLHARRS